MINSIFILCLCLAFALHIYFFNQEPFIYFKNVFHYCLRTVFSCVVFVFCFFFYKPFFVNKQFLLEEIVNLRSLIPNIRSDFLYSPVPMGFWSVENCPAGHGENDSQPTSLDCHSIDCLSVQQEYNFDPDNISRHLYSA